MRRTIDSWTGAAYSEEEIKLMDNCRLVETKNVVYLGEIVKANKALIHPFLRVHSDLPKKRFQREERSYISGTPFEFVVDGKFETLDMGMFNASKNGTFLSVPLHINSMGTHRIIVNNFRLVTRNGIQPYWEQTPSISVVSFVKGQCTKMLVRNTSGGKKVSLAFVLIDEETNTKSLHRHTYELEGGVRWKQVEHSIPSSLFIRGKI